MNISSLLPDLVPDEVIVHGCEIQARYSLPWGTRYWLVIIPGQRPFYDIDWNT